MAKIFKYQWLAVAALAIGTACQKDWNGHNEITDEKLTKTLQQLLSERTELSKFTQLVAQSSYASVLSTSKTFTVFAPTNDALASLDPAITSDTAKLNKFVGNHIANLRYLTSQAAADTLRIEMLNGKFNNMFGNKVEDASITGADLVAKNGALQIVDKMVPNQMNIWELVSSAGMLPAKQSSFLLKLNYDAFDSTKAEQIGVDPNTGRPIYKPGTGIVKSNQYWDRVYDLRNEEAQFTFFAMEDASYDAEVTKYKPYFITGTTDSTSDLASLTVCKDLTLKGMYSQASLPDTLISKYGVKVGINKASIVRTIKASNGIVYVMSNLAITPQEKFKEIIIQGERPSGTSHDRRSNTYYRDRINSITGLPFSDIFVYNHGVSSFNIRYRLREIPSIKYKAYWVALNDFQTATFTQRLAPGSATSTVFAYTTVAVNNPAEVYIGEFTVPAFQPNYDVFLVGAANTVAATNPLVCDYIRLVPSF